MEKPLHTTRNRVKNEKNQGGKEKMQGRKARRGRMRLGQSLGLAQHHLHGEEGGGAAKF